MTAIQHADAYRGYGAALQLLSGRVPASTDPNDRPALQIMARVSNYLYESGHIHWIALCKLSTTEFAHAFDASRAKAA